MRAFSSDCCVKFSVVPSRKLLNLLLGNFKIKLWENLNPILQGFLFFLIKKKSEIQLLLAFQ